MFVGTDEILLGDANALVTAVERAGSKITCRRDRLTPCRPGDGAQRS